MSERHRNAAVIAVLQANGIDPSIVWDEFTEKGYRKVVLNEDGSKAVDELGFYLTENTPWPSLGVRDAVLDAHEQDLKAGGLI